MRARWTIIGALVALGVMIGGLPGLADEHELDPADRVLIHSYDPEAMQLLWSIEDDPDAEDACTVDEEATYTYEVDEEGNVTVSNEEGELENCTFNATDVTGPEGQVNHGTVVAAFVHALRESGVEGGIGCYVRIVAQSDYGKGDQQVNVPDVEEPEEGDGTIQGSTSFTVSETTCGQPDDAGQPENTGKPDWAGQGKPDWAGTEGPPPHAKGGRP